MIIGCDPGLTGALAVIDDAGALLSVTDMPTMMKRVNGKDRLRLNVDAIEDWFRDHRDMMGAKRFVIEKVQGLPGQSAPAAFQFGYGYGMLLSTSRMLGYEVRQVTPQEWKSKMVRSWDRTDKFKRNSLLAATRLFGTNEEWRYLKNHGRAEAALIALYGAKHIWNAE